MEVLQTLWSYNISAEIASDARSPEDLLSQHRDENYSWIIIVKPEQMLKIKTLGRKDVPDADVQLTQMLSWLRSEIRDRDAKAVVKLRGATAAQQAEAGTGQKDHEQEVRVLVAQTKSKKFNRQGEALYFRAASCATCIES